jgi:8-oxo-dGTP pyrophosphatase MutT (NUDIX family)
MSASARLHTVALGVYRRLPTSARRLLVRTIAPSYTVGAIVFIERSDGAILLVRQSYRRAWGVPGGLLKRGEDVADGARREVFEETGLAVDLVGEPAVVVEPDPQRIDVVFRARPAADSDPADAGPRSPEIVEVCWFLPTDLPDLQAEASTALVTLARSAAAPSARPLPVPGSTRRT